jgi:hemoglobin
MTEDKKSLAAWFREKFGKEPFTPLSTLTEAVLDSDFMTEVTNSIPTVSPISESESITASSDKEVEPPSLYEQLGGASAVDAAVDIFYRKVLSDERISHFFEDVDMVRQAAKQKALLTMAFGGPHQYTGQDMRAAHAHLANRSWKNYSLIYRLQTQRKSGEDQGKVERGLKDSHFDAVLENLRDTLAELGIAEHLIAQVNAIAESTRNDVLGR